MSELNVPKFDEQLFELDRALSDPVMVRTLAKAKHLNELLNHGMVEDKDFGSIIEMLDAEWEPFMKEQILISGDIVYQISDEPERHFVSEYPAISCGFSILPAIRNQDGQLLSENTYPIIRHHLYIQANKLAGEEDQPDDEFIPAFADLNLHIEPMTFSFERAEAWLATSFPEFKDEIDAVIAASKGDEVALLLALKHIMLPDRLNGADESAKRCLVRYIGEFMKMDNDVPYLMSFYFAKQSSEEAQGIADVVQVSTNVFKPYGIGIDTVKMGGQHQYSAFSVLGYMHGPDKNLDPVSISIPLPLIIDFEAIRVLQTDNTYLEILP